MSQPTKSNAGVVVVDANIFISICSQEPSALTARAALADYTTRNWAFYAPGVIFSEVLFALCRKLQDSVIDAAAHQKAVEDFHLSFVPALAPPPNGDAALVLRAEEIRQGYSCLSSADAFYIALCEMLAQSGAAELLTFDKRLVNLAANNSPTVMVNLLPS